MNERRKERRNDLTTSRFNRNPQINQRTDGRTNQRRHECTSERTTYPRRRRTQTTTTTTTTTATTAMAAMAAMPMTKTTTRCVASADLLPRVALAVDPIRIGCRLKSRGRREGETERYSVLHVQPCLLSFVSNYSAPHMLGRHVVDGDMMDEPCGSFMVLPLLLRTSVISGDLSHVLPPRETQAGLQPGGIDTFPLPGERVVYVCSGTYRGLSTSEKPRTIGILS